MYESAHEFLLKYARRTMSIGRNSTYQRAAKPKLSPKPAAKPAVSKSVAAKPATPAADPTLQIQNRMLQIANQPTNQSRLPGLSP